MYRCILVPLDGTGFGEQAIPAAVAIARRSGAILHLAHVHLPPIIPSGAETAALPPVWIEMSWDQKKNYLEGLADRLRASIDVEVETRVMQGAVASAIEQDATRCAAGLIVMSTHGHVGLSRLWHHGVADQLARALPIPLLLVRADEKREGPDPGRGFDFDSIIIPLDGSADSELIIEHAVTLGRTFGAHYTLVRVVQGDSGATTGRGEHSSSATDAPPLEAQTEMGATQYLNALAERLRSRKLEVATRVVVAGNVAAAILEQVRTSRLEPGGGIDLIAVESPERGAVTRLLFRDTADELIRNSPVPVLLFQGRRTVARDVLAGSGMVGSE